MLLLDIIHTSLSIDQFMTCWCLDPPYLNTAATTVTYNEWSIMIITQLQVCVIELCTSVLEEHQVLLSVAAV